MPLTGAARNAEIRRVLTLHPEWTRAKAANMVDIIARDMPGWQIAAPERNTRPVAPPDAVSPPLWYMQWKMGGKQPARGTVDDGTYRFGMVIVDVKRGVVTQRNSLSLGGAHEERRPKTPTAVLRFHFLGEQPRADERVPNGTYLVNNGRTAIKAKNNVLTRAPAGLVEINGLTHVIGEKGSVVGVRG